MAPIETALTFTCQQEQLVGIHHAPENPHKTGVLIIVGGPQYRAGSHRFFTLTARYLAQQGFPVFRFDYRGMGDSSGAARQFDDIDDDIRSAVDAFSAASPDIAEFVLWGLCDAASASMFYAARDPRVGGIIALNPWVRTTQTQAKTYLKYYYVRRLAQAGFWKKILSEKSYFFTSAKSILDQAKLARQDDSESHEELPARMLNGLRQFNGPVLFILSGNDLTAKEFILTVNTSPEWQDLLAESRFFRHDLTAADHTFSSGMWRDQVAEWTCQWLLENGRHD
jgi:exosortase A-associated hydrolase 1